MTGKAISLDEFILNWPLWGEWKLHYFDRTHIAANKLVALGDISIQYDESAARSNLILPFTFKSSSEEEITDSLKNAGISSTDPTEKLLPSARLILDILAESAARCGMTRYELELLGKESLSDALPYLAELPFIILVTDTGALRRGVSTFITNSLPNKTIWTIIPVFVMIEVQERADNIKSVSDDTNVEPNSKYIKIIRQRPQVSCVAREIQYIKLNRPIEFVQAVPELISRVKGFKPDELKAGKDSLRDSVNDRLIIEATKRLRQERSLGKELFLITSDKNTASLAQLENLDAIYIKKPQLAREITSVRYNSFNPELNRRIVACPIHHLLWDFTHVFSTIHLSNETQGKHYELNYYSDLRVDLTHDVIEIRES